MFATAVDVARPIIDNITFDVIAGCLVAIAGWEARVAPKRWRVWRYERRLMRGDDGGPGILPILPAGTRIANLEVGQAKLIADFSEFAESMRTQISTNGTGKPIGATVVEIAQNQTLFSAALKEHLSNGDIHLFKEPSFHSSKEPD